MVLTLSSYAANIFASYVNGVQVEIDRTWYLAGEVMKVCVTDGDGLIAYAELCDTYGLAAGVMVSLKEGKGTGIIKLPSNLHSGYYLLTVYTRQNATASCQFVAIINPLQKSEDDDIEWVKVMHPDSLSFPRTEGNNEESVYRSSTIQTFDLHETDGHIIKARVKNTYNGKTFRSGDICTSLSIIGKQIHYFEGKMINDTIAVFNTFGIHGKQPLVLSARSTNGVSLPIEMISPFANLLPKTLPHLIFYYNRKEVEGRSIDMQQHQIKDTDIVPLDDDDTLFGTKPDLSYNLDEYRQFLTIREVLLEYVEFVKNTKINGEPRLIVRKGDEPYNSSLPTLVLIDGMPVFDTERLLNYDARRVHYINIFGGQYTFGNGVYNGILSFITRSGQLTNYPTEPNMQYLEYKFPE